ncbi:hypothetical protein OG874_01165 [Nocardia sp. NBC_00565]|uniref:DNA gyrase subunit A n=1 Tax=Nocardia sp. NBC_00565 TaxID=2975993 RepID=UPI002E800CF0|nr:DNA gyrase subunit A [Nocardia sp. NBC_00565]WUC03858.1 hypothetical protein OG874_01165 [Nocardia sp. NBC_00565]
MTQGVSRAVAKDRERLELLTALATALDRRDELVALVAGCTDQRQAERDLVARFGFTQSQTTVVLDMQIRRLTQFDRERIAEELAAVRARLHHSG